MPKFANISEFCDAVTKEKLTLFLGAGVSLAYPSTLPLARDLISGFYKALNDDPQIAALASELPGDALDTLRSPELIYNAVSEYAVQVVPRLFQAALDCDRPNVNHWIAAQLLKCGLVERIITTNFDPLIERCYGSEEVSLRLEDDRSEGKSEVWKIHGDLHRRMAIALNDVAVLGFSPVPALLAETLVRKCVVIAGYSGNDFHVVRAIVDGRPKRVWWIVRCGDIPEAVNILSLSVPNLVVIEGDLSRSDINNPLVALWLRVRHGAIPENLVHAKGAKSSVCLSERLSDVLSGLAAGQKGLVLHSLMRRVGRKTTLGYRQRLSSLLQETMYRLDGFSRGSLSYAKDNDWVEFFERLFTPHIAARPVVLRRHGIESHESDGFAGWQESELWRGKGLNWREEADILLEVGLENAFRGKFEQSRAILEAAFKCAKMKDLRALRMRSAEALAWVCLQLGELRVSDDYHADYLREIKDVIRDFRVLRDLTEPLAYNDLLRNFDPPDKPRLYNVLTLDYRYRSVVQALQLAGRLRYMGKADLGIEVIERLSVNSKDGSAYVHALTGFQRLEKARCLFSLCKVREGLELIESAEEALKEIENWDYEVLRQFYRTIQEYYVKSGRMGKMLEAMLNASRVL